MEIQAPVSSDESKTKQHFLNTANNFRGQLETNKDEANGIPLDCTLAWRTERSDVTIGS